MELNYGYKKTGSDFVMYLSSTRRGVYGERFEQRLFDQPNLDVFLLSTRYDPRALVNNEVTTYTLTL